MFLLKDKSDQDLQCVTFFVFISSIKSICYDFRMFAALFWMDSPKSRESYGMVCIQKSHNACDSFTI